ncbi:hypothetical protein J5J86_21625 [Aquabacter sp. L1I39]|uniref:hypothetical protein n=1 Tax=Aquabacter sp. L1I39 TaxID=2820278 RepID=UPI001ADB4643|nr:hypothetical protein [Aquabacter sp. L1I39]QTL03311.1 hypothetical protein J5J86_21625 [Aquabacter sp. L1I39]
MSHDHAHRAGSLLAVLLAAAFMGPAEAANRPKCLEGAGFKVAYRERTQSVGSDIVVHSGPSATCTLKTAGGFRVGGADDAFYVKGLAGAVLVLDAGTGPDRQVRLYDLATRRTLLTSDYDDDQPLTITPQSVTFWEVGGTADASNCKDFASITANGLAPALARQVTVRLPGLARSASGPERCIARQ